MDEESIDWRRLVAAVDNHVEELARGAGVDGQQLRVNYVSATTVLRVYDVMSTPSEPVVQGDGMLLPISLPSTRDSVGCSSPLAADECPSVSEPTLTEERSPADLPTVPAPQPAAESSARLKMYSCDLEAALDGDISDPQDDDEEEDCYAGWRQRCGKGARKSSAACAAPSPAAKPPPPPPPPPPPAFAAQRNLLVAHGGSNVAVQLSALPENDLSEMWFFDLSNYETIGLEVTPAGRLLGADVRVGAACVVRAKHADVDAELQWARGLVERVDGALTVRLVDSGRSVRVHAADVRAMPPQLGSVPPRAYRGCFADERVFADFDAWRAEQPPNAPHRRDVLRVGCAYSLRFSRAPASPEGPWIVAELFEGSWDLAQLCSNFMRRGADGRCEQSGAGQLPFGRGPSFARGFSRAPFGRRGGRSYGADRHPKTTAK